MAKKSQERERSMKTERDIIKQSEGKLNGKLNSKNQQQEVHGKKDSWVEVSVLSVFLPQ
jgi:hypothetical protein